MWKWIRGIGGAIVPLLLRGQQLPYPTYVNPPTLFVAGTATTIRLVNASYTAGLTALWNGSPRQTTQSGSDEYTVAVTAADLAAAQLAQITMVTSQGAVIDTVNLPVVYNVLPTGVAYDAVRNRVYVATPAQPGDSAFPGNSVVAVDLSSGRVGPVVQIGGALGDLALSDDASALYVIDEGDNLVRRIDPATFKDVADFSFRTGKYTGPYNPAYDINDAIAVMPGKPGTVAVGFHPIASSSGIQLSIYDAGVARPNGLPEFSSMVFSPDGSYLFLDSFYYPSGPMPSFMPTVFRFSIDNTGIPTQSPAFALGSGAAVAVNGTLYTSAATAIDYSSMTLTGTFGVRGPIAVDQAQQRAYILYTPPPLNDEGQTPPPELVSFRLPTLEILGSQNIGISALSPYVASKQLIHFGSDGFIVPSTSGLLIFHTPLAGPTPVTTANAVVNAASQQASAIAPGEILTIYGSNLGPSGPQAAAPNAGYFPSLLDGTQVLFNQLPGTLLLSAQGQINVVAPFELAPGTTINLQVWHYGNPSTQIPLSVASAAPALFTQDGSGGGVVAVINQDGSVDAPSPAGTVVELYGTGGGVLSGATDGAIATSASNLAAATHVTIAGQDAQVLYAGTAPGLVNGVFQLNVQIPPGIASGAAPIVVTIGGESSREGATLAIR